MRRALVPTAAVLCALLGTLAQATQQAAGFGAPVKLNSSGWGYEPSIDVDARGTLYVTAHKGSTTNEGTRLSSFLWRSADGGASWQEMASPAHVAESAFSFEGDIAVDTAGRLYFVDTYGADSWLARWSAEGGWERTAPAVTASAFDDRPWIATQGKDVVWLLTTDLATHAAANGVPEVSDGSGWASSAVLYRSADGGLTWSPGTAFPDAQFCGLAASPYDTTSLAVACVERAAPGTQRLTVHRTGDSGSTWTQQQVFDFKARADSFVSVAYGKGGELVTAFADDVATGHRLHVARGGAHGWSVTDVTPFRGAFQHVWVAADRKGKVGVAFYGTSTPIPTADSDWYVYAGSVVGAQRWAFRRADPRPVIRAPYAPADFLQCVVAPNGRLYVAYSRATTTDVLHSPPPDFDHDIYVVSERHR